MLRVLVHARIFNPTLAGEVHAGIFSPTLAGEVHSEVGKRFLRVLVQAGTPPPPQKGIRGMWLGEPN